MNEILRQAIAERTYLRLKSDGKKETWEEASLRSIEESIRTGNLSQEQIKTLHKLQISYVVTASGRQLWVGGTDWAKDPENFLGLYNCTSISMDRPSAFAELMNLGMMGCGTGADLRMKHISKLPPIVNEIAIRVVGEFGAEPNPIQETKIEWGLDEATIWVGDSRQGWVQSYQALINMAMDSTLPSHIPITIDLSSVRPAGRKLKGFGGVSNPVALPDLYKKCAAILNGAIGRQLTQSECCFLIDYAAEAFVAGNIRRSAGMRQFDPSTPLLKKGMWQTDQDGHFIDTTRQSHRVANHTRVYNYKPSYKEIEEAVREQFHSGEGAIQWAGEALARANADLWADALEKRIFLGLYSRSEQDGANFIKNRFLQRNGIHISPEELEHRMDRVGLNPCVTGDTWVHTEQGARQVKDLVGRQFSAYVNGDLFSSTKKGFWSTGTKPVFRVVTEEGYTLRLTENHKLLLVTTQTRKQQYSVWVETKDLQPGDRILLHNHREIAPWYGKGSFDEGAKTGKLLAVGGSAEIVLGDNKPTLVEVETLKTTKEIEEAGHDFYIGFLSSFLECQMMTIGYGGKRLTVTIRESYSVELTAIIQRMLGRIGIICTATDRNLTLTGDNIHFFISCIAAHGSPSFMALDQVTTKELLERSKRLAPERFSVQIKEITLDGEEEVFDCTIPGVNRFDGNGFVAHNCGEIIGKNYPCNLAQSDVSQIEPLDLKAQEEAFAAAGLLVASLLHQEFTSERLQQSRQLDPIVGVSFTGAFDFFVTLFGGDWLRWWQEGRPEGWGPPTTSVPLGEEFSQSTLEEWRSLGQYYKAREAEYFRFWRSAARKSVQDYCKKNGLRIPNRVTTVQPAGTKSLLTGASPGWHPPKSHRFIRRVAFNQGNPIALACKDLGCSIIPDSSCVDESGRMLSDCNDSRSTTWLVEFLVETSWANIADEVGIDLSSLPAKAQWDFYMNVQKHYADHNASATIEFWEDEIELLSCLVYEAIQNDEGYISAALMGRYKNSKIFPRLPYEPVSKEEFIRLKREEEARATETDFSVAFAKRNEVSPEEGTGPNPCDSEKCSAPNLVGR